MLTVEYWFVWVSHKKKYYLYIVYDSDNFDWYVLDFIHFKFLKQKKWVEVKKYVFFQDILDTCKDGPVMKINDTRLESVKKSSTERTRLPIIFKPIRKCWGHCIRTNLVYPHIPLQRTFNDT